MLLNSKLPVDVLGRVWDLSDIDGDGFLDREEFAVVSTLHTVIFIEIRALAVYSMANKFPDALKLWSTRKN